MFRRLLIVAFLMCGFSYMAIGQCLKKDYIMGVDGQYDENFTCIFKDYRLCSLQKEELHAVKDMLREHLKDNTNVRFADYHRQYFKYRLDGVDYVYVNAFCDVPDVDLERDFVFVFDGGDCYFQAIINLETQKIERLTFNGNA